MGFSPSEFPADGLKPIVRICSSYLAARPKRSARRAAEAAAGQLPANRWPTASSRAASALAPARTNAGAWPIAAAGRPARKACNARRRLRSIVAVARRSSVKSQRQRRQASDHSCQAPQAGQRTCRASAVGDACDAGEASDVMRPRRRIRGLRVPPTRALDVAWRPALGGLAEFRDQPPQFGRVGRIRLPGELFSLGQETLAAVQQLGHLGGEPLVRRAGSRRPAGRQGHIGRRSASAAGPDAASRVAGPTLASAGAAGGRLGGGGLLAGPCGSGSRRCRWSVASAGRWPARWRRTFKIPSRVEVELHEDLVAGVHLGQAVEQELAHRVVVADVVVFALEDGDAGQLLAVGRPWRRFRCGGRAAASCGRSAARSSSATAGPSMSPSAWMPSVCGVMSTRTGPTSIPAIRPPWIGGAHGHAQVGVHLGVDRLAELLLEQLVHQRRAAGPADQDHLVDLVGVELGVGQRLVDAAGASWPAGARSALRSRCGGVRGGGAAACPASRR